MEAVSFRSIYLADKVFCYKQGMGTDRYLNWEKLYNAERTGYMQKLAPSEGEIFRHSLLALERWRKQRNIPEKELQELYFILEQLALSAFNNVL